jgi:betaine-aldehyde dehydrogenase
VWVRDKLFIANRWVEPSGTRKLDVISPVTEKVVGRTPHAEFADVDRAVEAAQRAFQHGPWPRMSLDERAEVLRRVGKEFATRAPVAVDQQIDEMGGTRRYVETVTLSVPAVIERMIDDAALVPFREVRRGSVSDVLVLRDPIGVAAGILPWNAPVLMAVEKLFPALLMGCPMVLKPAPESPLSIYALADAIDAADLPDGTVSVLPGGVGIGECLVAHPGIQKVTFTGSSAAGAAIAAVCGQQLKSVTLELGGKSAAVILDDDFHSYVPTIVQNALRNCGQVCISPNRVLVRDGQHDAFVVALVEHLGSLKVGDPHEPETDFGPVVSQRQREKVEGFIDRARAAGAHVAFGGGRPAGFDHGWYVVPTVLVDVDNSMEVAQEEIFGPVISVIRYRDEADAVAIANDSAYGLGGTVFAADPAHAVAVALQIDTGTCQINEAPGAGGGGPFGGRKKSGLGAERSREGNEQFLEIKSVTLPRGYTYDQLVGAEGATGE